MSSKQVLLQHFQATLVSHNYSFDEFLKTVSQSYRNKHESEPEIATVREWYSKYQHQDQAALQLVEQRIEKFLDENREAQLHELESLQVAESLSLEQIVDKLDHVDQLLTNRLEYINGALEKNIVELGSFNELLEIANSKEIDKKEDTNSIETLRGRLSAQGPKNGQ